MWNILFKFYVNIKFNIYQSDKEKLKNETKKEFIINDKDKNKKKRFKRK